MKRFFNNILNLLDYCFYRVIHNKIVNPPFLATEDRLGGCIGLIIAFNLAIIFYLIAMLMQAYSIPKFISPIWLIVLCPILTSVRYNSKRIGVLQKTNEWENEKNKSLKGWLVAFWMIGSFVLFILMVVLYSNSLGY